jgi:RHS repeat-associated protein
LSKSYSDGTPVAQYIYDSYPGLNQQNLRGRLAFSGTNNGSVWLAQTFPSYDAMGRVAFEYLCTTCSRGWYFTPTYSYDYFGDMTSYTNGAYGVGQGQGVTFTQAFDSAGRVTRLTSTFNDSQHPATLATVDSSAGYWPQGAIQKSSLGNGLTQTSAFNNRLQPCRVNVNSSGTNLSACNSSLPSGNVQDFSYGFNAGSSDNGNVASWTGTGNQAFTRSYTYDALNRLSTLSDSISGNSCPGLSWSYDPWGNRTAQTVTSGSCGSSSLSYNSSNRITNSGFQYDAAGNLTNDGTHSYTYDAENRISKVDGGATATYVYNADNKRVLKTVGGVTTEYYYDLSGNVLGEAQGTTVSANYVYLNNQLLAEYTGGTTYFLHQDHLGSTRLMTNVSGGICKSMDYLPFGEINGTSGTCSTTQKFTGYERDAETDPGNGTGNDFAEARYYGSRMGRFLSPDPLGGEVSDPQSFNAYAYTINNPMNLTDPDGMNPCDGLTLCYDSSVNLWFADGAPGLYYSPISSTQGGPGPALLGLMSVQQWLDYLAASWANAHNWGCRGDVCRGATQVAKDTVVGSGKEVGNTFIGAANLVNSPIDALLSNFTDFRFGHGSEFEASTPGEKGAMLGTSIGLLLVRGPTAEGIKLSKAFASEAQVAEKGTSMAGARSTKILRDASRLAATYGGKESEWAKMSSEAFQAKGEPRSAAFETHRYENTITGLRVEFKTVANWMKWLPKR